MATDVQAEITGLDWIDSELLNPDYILMNDEIIYTDPARATQIIDHPINPISPTNPFLNNQCTGFVNVTNDESGSVVNELVNRSCTNNSYVSNQENNTDRDEKLADAINKLAMSNIRKNIDISHVQPFSGEGGSTNVATKLTYFLNDMDELGKERPITEHELLLLAKKKLIGSARDLVSMSRPKTFSDLVKLLTSSYSSIDGDHEEILQQLKNIRIQKGQNFIQLATKSKELAALAALRLQCNTSSKIVFDAFAKGLLANFQPYVKVQNDISKAVARKDCDSLVAVLQNLLKTDQSILIRSEIGEVNRIKFQGPNHNNRQVTEIKCQLCDDKNHLALDCFKFKDKGSNTNNSDNQDKPEGVVETRLDNHANRSDFRYSDNRSQNDRYNQNYIPNNEFYGRTPRYYQPRQNQGYRPRFYTPVDFRGRNRYDNFNRNNQQYYGYDRQYYSPRYQSHQYSQNHNDGQQDFQVEGNNSNPS